jgi:hypothetical protein
MDLEEEINDRDDDQDQDNDQEDNDFGLGLRVDEHGQRNEEAQMDLDHSQQTQNS